MTDLSGMGGAVGVLACVTTGERVPIDGSCVAEPLDRDISDAAVLVARLLLQSVSEY